MRKNTKEDIWKFIDKKGPTDCWNYIGSSFNGRYGRFFYEGKTFQSHRFIYEHFVGLIPEGFYIMHKCNNIKCCNPAHLVPGTNSENQRHCSASGGYKVGKSGIRGISYDKRRNYWTAQAYLNGKRYNLYTGPHKDKAIKARSKWETQYYITFNLGEFK